MTPVEHLIQSKNDEIVSKWNRARFRRLAMVLNLTETELHRMAYGLPIHLRDHLKKNRFPAPIAGHLENIEQWALHSKLGERFKPTAQDIILQQSLNPIPV